MEKSVSIEDLKNSDFLLVEDGLRGIFAKKDPPELGVFIAKTETMAQANIVDFSQLRSFREVVTTANLLVGSSGRRGAHAVGEGIGKAIGNAKLEREAKEKTGVEIRTSNLALPRLFATFSNDELRAQAVEALTQISESSSPPSYNNFSERTFSVKKSSSELLGEGITKLGANHDHTPLIQRIPKIYYVKTAKYFLLAIFAFVALFIILRTLRGMGL